MDKAVDVALLAEDSEKLLYSQLQLLESAVPPLLQTGDYEKVLSQLATLKDSVDAFFDQVMVMCEDERIKNNRIALLYQLRKLFLKVADISCLQL